MALIIGGEIIGSHVDDASLVNVSWRDVTGCDEVAKPLRRMGVNLVVVSWHQVFVRSPPLLPRGLGNGLGWGGGLGRGGEG